MKAILSFASLSTMAELSWNGVGRLSLLKVIVPLRVYMYTVVALKIHGLFILTHTVQKVVYMCIPKCTPFQLSAPPSQWSPHHQ